MRRDKRLAKKYGIPKALHQYAKRYGGLDADDILQIHWQAALRARGQIVNRGNGALS
jgi:hypothetical protein